MEPGLAKCSRKLVIKWHKRFIEGEFNVNNSPRTGQPLRTEHDIAWIPDIVKTDCKKRFGK